MCRIARIDAFTKRWPLAEFGPAHIVLSDANVDDSNIDWCIGLCEQWLGTAPRSEDPAEVEMWAAVEGWRDHEAEEIAATLAFLREYRTIPEDERVEDTDTLCGELTEES